MWQTLEKEEIKIFINASWNRMMKTLIINFRHVFVIRQIKPLSINPITIKYMARQVQ